MTKKINPIRSTPFNQHFQVASETELKLRTINNENDKAWRICEVQRQ